MGPFLLVRPAMQRPLFRFRSRFRSLCLALTLLSLFACGHTPVTRTLFDAIPGLSQKADSINLNPSLRYLRVTVRGRVVLMVLGYVEPHPEGQVETWYSSEGEVIRLQNGRIVATAGLETDWRAVRNFSLPAWKDLVGRPAVVYRRERDEMPGYRFGIAESVSLYPVAVPSNARLVGLPAAGRSKFASSNPAGCRPASAWASPRAPRGVPASCAGPAPRRASRTDRGRRGRRPETSGVSGSS